MLSDLQLTLAGVGALILVAVYGFNRWQEAQLRRRAEAQFPKSTTDPLVGAGNVTASNTASIATATEAVGHHSGPTLDPITNTTGGPTLSATPGGSDAGVGAVEHTLGLPPMAAVPAPLAAGPTERAPLERTTAPSSPIRPFPPLAGDSAPNPSAAARAAPMASAVGAVLDPRLDYTATMRFADPHSGEAILRNARELRAVKPVHWEAYSETQRRWTDLAADIDYNEVRVGFQLVDRGGIASDEDVVEFCRSVQSLAATLVAQTDYPSRTVALRAAAELDRLCAEVDIQIGFNVVKSDGAPIPATKVRTLAESYGCALRDDGRFVLVTPDGADALAIANLEPNPFRADELARVVTRAVALILDVPRAPDSDATFRQFVENAQQMARALEGDLVDDHRLPIAPGAMEAIGDAVAKARATMREASIPAGSKLARRLFA